MHWSAGRGAGSETKDKAMRKSALEAIAYHEAGHAVACVVHHVRVRKATIVPDAEVLGHVSHANPYGGVRLDVENSSRRARFRVERDILISLAGDAAERKFCNRRRFGAGSDYDRAVDAASYLCSSAEATEAYVNWLAVTASDWAEGHWPAIEKVAKALLQHKTLTGARVRELVLPPMSKERAADLVSRLHITDQEPENDSWSC
jgi:Peptidase family M41